VLQSILVIYDDLKAETDHHSMIPMMLGIYGKNTLY